MKNVSVEIAANIGQTPLIMEKWLKVFCDKLHDIYVDMGHRKNQIYSFIA